MTVYLAHACGAFCAEAGEQEVPTLHSQHHIANLIDRHLSGASSTRLMGQPTDSTAKVLQIEHFSRHSLLQQQAFTSKCSEGEPFVPR
jgi:hypothetical protein